MLKSFLLIVIMCFGTLTFCGCSVLEDFFGMNLRPYSPKYQIALKSIIKYPRGNDIEEIINDYYGNEIIVNTNEIFGSSKITKAELIPLDDKPGYFHIRLKPNQTGLKLWLQMAFDHSGDPVAILIDGVYFGLLDPTGEYDEESEWVVLKGPFNEVIARGIVRFAVPNFRHYSPNAPDF